MSNIAIQAILILAYLMLLTGVFLLFWSIYTANVLKKNKGISLYIGIYTSLFFVAAVFLNYDNSLLNAFAAAAFNTLEALVIVTILLLLRLEKKSIVKQ